MPSKRWKVCKKWVPCLVDDENVSATQDTGLTATTSRHRRVYRAYEPSSLNSRHTAWSDPHNPQGNMACFTRIDF